jgi:hypothetical protein
VWTPIGGSKGISSKKRGEGMFQAMFNAWMALYTQAVINNIELQTEMVKLTAPLVSEAVANASERQTRAMFNTMDSAMDIVIGLSSWDRRGNKREEEQEPEPELHGWHHEPRAPHKEE